MLWWWWRWWNQRKHIIRYRVDTLHQFYVYNDLNMWIHLVVTHSRSTVSCLRAGDTCNSAASLTGMLFEVSDGALNTYFTTKSLRQAEYFTSRLEWLRCCGKISNAPKWRVNRGLQAPQNSSSRPYKTQITHDTQHILAGVWKFSPDLL